MRIVPVEASTLESERAAFSALLVATVAEGGGIGFLAPLAPERASAYWKDVAREIREGHRLLFAAHEDGALVGSVQLELARRETGTHRAEVQKLMVDPRARRRGLAKALMARAEEAARAHGRTLLLLDTFEGTVADGMYRRWGWSVVGVVPNYARDPAGRLRPLTLFYKEIAPQFAVPPHSGSR